MITFDADITLYSLWKMGREAKWVRTHIPRVSWQGGQKVSVGEGGLLSADQYTVRILASSMDKYITPDKWRAFAKAPTDGSWTAQAGDVVVKGLVEDAITTGIAQITSKYTDCFVVTGAFDNRRIALKHLRIEGK